MARFTTRFLKKQVAGKRGSALMMAIFTVTMLMVIATEVVYQTSVEHLVSAQGVNGVQAYYAARAGAEISLLRIHLYLKALSQFGSSLPNKSMLDPIWQIPFSWPPMAPPAASAVDKDNIRRAIKDSTMKAQYAVTIEPETGKIDVNDLGSKSDALAKSARALLLQAFQTKMEYDLDFAAQFRGFDFNKILDAIRFYVSESKVDPGGLQSAYGDRGSDYMPPHRPFKTLQELRLVPGVDDRIFDLLLPRVTIYGAKGVNVNYASKDVLMSLNPRIQEKEANLIIAARGDPKRGPFKDIGEFVTFLNGIGISGNPFEAEKDAAGNAPPPPLLFDPEMNFRIVSTGVSGKIRREITAIVYDFDRVKARWTTFMPQAAPTPTPTPVGGGAVDMMRTLKRALDPKNILNPGKIFSL